MTWITFSASAIVLLIIGFQVGRKLDQLKKAQNWYEAFLRFYDLPDDFKLDEVATLSARDLIFGRAPNLPFDPWIEYGVSEGWITPTCLSHIGLPITPYEYATMQGTHLQWICDIVDRMTDADESEDDDSPHIFIARINGQNASLLNTGMEDLDDSGYFFDQLRGSDDE